MAIFVEEIDQFRDLMNKRYKLVRQNGLTWWVLQDTKEIRDEIKELFDVLPDVEKGWDNRDRYMVSFIRFEMDGPAVELWVRWNKIEGFKLCCLDPFARS